MRVIKGDPPKNEVVKRMLASGNWKLGPNGELLRVSAEEANQAAYEASRAQAMKELAEENPAKYKPTTVGFMTPERKAYLENLDRPLTEAEAREYATEAYNPSNPLNQAFSMVAGSMVPVPPLYKINPLAARTIPIRPDHYYRVVPGAAYDDLIKSGVVRARSTPAPQGASLLEQVNYRPTSRASFAKGKAMPEYGKGDPRAVVIEAGPRGGAWMNRSTPVNPITGTRTPRPSGRHFADFALDPKTGEMIDIPISDVTNVYRATPHPIKGYIKVN